MSIRFLGGGGGGGGGSKKWVRSLFTVWLAVTFVFIALRLTGDPAVSILSPEAPPSAIESFREAWGLNKPLWQQYLSLFPEHRWTGIWASPTGTAGTRSCIVLEPRPQDPGAGGQRP